VNKEDVLDIYQDSIIAFYENVENGKLTTLKSSLKTYIFSIGKYSIYNLMKKDNKTVSFEKEHIENLDLSIISDRMESESKVALVQEALNKIGERCRQVLILFYYHSYSIEALMHEMDYKNENVVRSHKSRCLKTLKEILSVEF
jgi:RNA polymerase sigma-70 factor (ECF subfamily)